MGLDKQLLREFYKKKRFLLSSEERLAFDKLILENLKKLDFQTVTFLHVFLPIDRLKEFNTYPFVNWIREAFPHIQLVLSRSDFSSNNLIHYIWSDRVKLEENKWGIPEPVNLDEMIEVPPSSIDFVLVPLLICDVRGNRVGYGKGYYDRFLALCRGDVLKVGVSYFEPVNGTILSEVFDVPLDLVITPCGTQYYVT